MTVLADRSHITADQFVLRPDRRDYELVQGQLVKRKLMGMRESYIATRVATLLNNHVENERLGYVFGADLNYRCFDDPDTLRRPDASFISGQRLSERAMDSGYATIAPDLAVEVVSPNDLAYDVQSKVELYLSAGIKVVWVLYPNTKVVEIHRPGQPTQTLRSHEQLSGEPVLRGFQVAVEHLFAVTGAAA